MRIEESTAEYNIADEPLVIGKATIDRILTLDNPSEALALYSFYYYTAKWQKTTKAKATEKYCRQGLKIGQRSFRRAKSALIDLGLIEDVQTIKKGKITGHYVNVKFVFFNSNHTLQNEHIEQENQTLQNALVQNVTTNALNTNKGNALNTNNIDYGSLMTFWNQKMPKEIRILTQDRKKSLRKIYNELIEAKPELAEKKANDVLNDLITWMTQSDFLMGRKADFTISFDWFIKSSNFVKIIEGNYHE